MNGTMSRSTSYLGVVACVLCTVAVVALAVPLQAQSASSAATQPKAFSNPQEAANALIKAATDYDQAALLEIFGAGGEAIISSADSVRDKANAAAFVAKAAEKTFVSIDPKNPKRAILTVGNDNWPLPIPLVKNSGKWSFDVKEGRQEILKRRIGANELDAIQVCRGYVEAQQEYAAEEHDGIHQYAQKIISSPGKQDGLYWVDASGNGSGPISEGIARAIQEGYTTNRGPYHGYYFKILKGQGARERLGQLDYVIEGVMIGGFALVAVPAEYRVTGVTTFLVNQDGIVYEKDLGPDSLNIVKNMDRFDPDKTWHATNDQWPSDASDDQNPEPKL